VLPIPFSIETIVLSRVIPSARPTERETIINDKNELIFTTRIKKRSRQIPRITMIRGISLYYIFTK
jgi:hypothetical protein